MGYVCCDDSMVYAVMLNNFKGEGTFNIHCCWRLVVTGFSFVLFGVGGMLVSLTFFSFVYLLPLNRHKKCVCTQYLLPVIFRAYIGFFIAKCLENSPLFLKATMQKNGTLNKIWTQPGSPCRLAG